MKISMDVFSKMYEDVTKKLLDENQCGGAWFLGDKEKFEDWAGDVFSEALEHCLNYFDIQIEEKIDKEKIDAWEWFQGDEEKFKDWAGNVLSEALGHCLNYSDIQIEEDIKKN